MRLASPCLPTAERLAHIGLAACAVQARLETEMSTSNRRSRKSGLIVAAALACVLGFGPARAQGPSDASAAMSGASVLSASIVGAGSAQAIAKGGQFVVKGIETVGQSTIVVLRGASDATQFSVKLAGQAVGSASLAVGTSVKVIAEAAGHSLVVAGKVFAFIPNEVGRSLLHQSRVKDTRAL